MNPLRTYDYLIRARQRLFDAMRPLDAHAYAQPFLIGLGTLGTTLTHLMTSEWYYMQRMTDRDVPPYEQWPIRQDDPPPFATLEPHWTAQADETRRTLHAITDWDAHVRYRVIDDDGTSHIITTSPADLFTQLALHEMHHRAQALNMLRHLGVMLDDLDFNAMMFDRRVTH